MPRSTWSDRHGHPRQVRGNERKIRARRVAHQRLLDVVPLPNAPEEAAEGGRAPTPALAPSPTPTLLPFALYHHAPLTPHSHLSPLNLTPYPHPLPSPLTLTPYPHASPSPSPLTPHPSPLTPHPSPLTPHPLLPLTSSGARGDDHGARGGRAAQLKRFSVRFRKRFLQPLSRRLLRPIYIVLWLNFKP